jgi:CSLREA domain-containing protein
LKRQGLITVVLALALMAGFASAAHGAQFNVNITADESDGGCHQPGDSGPDQDCSLRDAVARANANVGDDVVQVPLSQDMYDLSSPLPASPWDGKLTIHGIDALAPGAASPPLPGIVAPSGQRLIPLGGAFELHGVAVFAANPVGPATTGSGGLIAAGSSSLTISNSVVVGGGSTVDGGAVDASGPVFVTRSFFASSHTQGFGGAIHLGSAASATITDSFFVGNTAVLGGGAIQNGGALTLTNDSFFSNSAGDFGGAVDNFDAGGAATVDLNSGTFARNIADADSSGVGDGGALNNGEGDVGSMFRVTNSILEDNSLHLDTQRQCAAENGATFTSSGFNFRSAADTGCPGFGAVGDQLATPNLDLTLTAGDSFTFAPPLQPGPGVDQGGNCPPTDANGRSRAPYAPCDAGAYEMEKPLPGAPPPVRHKKCKKKKKRKKKRLAASAKKKKCKRTKRK